MKVLEAQSAVLSNYEVHQHLTELENRINKKTQNLRGKERKEAVPGNLLNVIKEVLDWFHDNRAQHPLSYDPIPYKPETITILLERLRPYDLSKGELIMILNNHPFSPPGLNIVVEDMAERLTPEQQQQLLTDIIEVLGKRTPRLPSNETAPEDAQGSADVTMGDSAA